METILCLGHYDAKFKLEAMPNPKEWQIMNSGQNVYLVRYVKGNK